MISNEFNPDKITSNDMKELADNIESYLSVFQEVMIIPKEVLGKKEQIEAAIKTVKKLIRKLRAGDSGVFKDREDWNSIM